MVDEFSTIILTLCAVGIILNGIGLLLLNSLKNCEIDKIQKYIIIILCLINFSRSIIFTIEQVLYRLEVNISHTLTVCIEISCCGYYCATFWLILDRYLHIKLNIKYVIYWSRRKTIIATMILWSFATLNGSLIVLYALEYDFVLLAAFDLVIVVFSAYVYIYALLLLKLQRSNVRSNQSGRGILKGMLLPAIIVLTFLLLNVIPETIMAVKAIYGKSNYSGKIIWYTWLVYPVSCWTDALIYIFVSPRIKLVVTRNIKCLFSKMCANTERSESTYIKSFKDINNKSDNKVILVSGFI